MSGKGLGLIKLRIRGKKKDGRGQSSTAASSTPVDAPPTSPPPQSQTVRNRRTLRGTPVLGMWSYDRILRIPRSGTAGNIAEVLTKADLHVPILPLARPRTLAIQTGPDKGVFELMARFCPMVPQDDFVGSPVEVSVSSHILSASSLLSKPVAATSTTTTTSSTSSTISSAAAVVVVPSAASSAAASSSTTSSSAAPAASSETRMMALSAPASTSTSSMPHTNTKTRSAGRRALTSSDSHDEEALNSSSSLLGRTVLPNNNDAMYVSQWEFLTGLHPKLAKRVSYFLASELSGQTDSGTIDSTSNSGSNSNTNNNDDSQSVAIGSIVLRSDVAEESSSSTMHTYPVPPDGPPLESATIADSYLIVSDGNRMFWSIADGIGHGMKPRHAAMAALSAFWFSVEAQLGDVVEKADSQAQAVLELLVHSVHKAQQLVCGIGSDHTTLLGGVIVRLKTSAKNPWPWIFLGTGVGDCKCYRWSKATGLCEEITLDPPAKHMRDPGGFLGFESPVDSVFTYVCPLEEGDVIIAMSDGVHDNLDPATLKISPRYFGFLLDDWQDLEDEEPEKTREVKRQFRQRRLEQLLGAYSSSVSTKDIVEKIVDYTIGTTADLRSAEEKGMLLQTQWETLPPEEALALKREVIRLQKTAPGKYDHCTVFAIQVGLGSTDAHLKTC